MIETFSKLSITSELAQKMIDAATSKAQEINIPMAIAIMDDSGDLKAFRKMDGTSVLSASIAQKKAWTAAVTGMSTDQWYEFIKNDPPLHLGFIHASNIVVFGGGFPISVNNQTIGGIGVSGGHYTQDMECAKAALALLGSD
jgi:uncharacterized protein GlcG (DUF336 family)